MCQMQAYWTAPFLFNLLNSVVFLVETSHVISVFFANYKGRPWMKGMLANRPLFLSVFAQALMLIANPDHENKKVLPVLKQANTLHLKAI